MHLTLPAKVLLSAISSEVVDEAGDGSKVVKRVEGGR
jgi:hypothetical protein